MSGEQLEECFKILYDMELNNYLMSRGYAMMVNNANNLGYKPDRKEPTQKSTNTDFGIIGATMTLTATIGAIFTALSNCSGGNNLFEQILSLIDVVGGAILGGLMGGLIGIPVGLIAFFIADRTQASKNREEYNDEYRTFQNTLKQDEYRRQSELKQKKVIMEEARKLNSQYNDSSKRLNEFYNMAGIDKKFRNIVSVGYMYEFIRLGISRKIQGADGLYYLTMHELRWDQMQYTLQEISEKLDMIIDQNHQIYAELVLMNQRCGKLVNSVEAMAKEMSRSNRIQEENSRVMRYNQERIKNELEFQSRMMLITR